MSALLIAGSPALRSRSGAVLDVIGYRLAAHGAQVAQLPVRTLPAQALLLADTAQPEIAKAVAQVAAAKVLVVATPVYKAAYSGILKVFLDLLPQTALNGKTVLPIVTGGSAHHMLALDYALRPVLQSLGAQHILPGIYANDAQIALTPEGAYVLTDDIASRLDEAIRTLVTTVWRAAPAPAAATFEDVPFSQVRCSV